MSRLPMIQSQQQLFGITNRETRVPLILSIVWMLSLALFVVHEIRFWTKKMPLAISIAAWLLYAALVYLRIVP
jgi:hypothetical protein